MEETIIEDTPKGEQHFHTPFTGKEVWEVVFQMGHNIFGIRRVPNRVFQRFWDVINANIMTLFSDFQQGML
jgi:hypothetical protein